VSNGTATRPGTEDEITDIPIVPSAAGGDFETVPAGAYKAMLIGFREVDTPEWKLQQKRSEGKEPDTKQWQWKFRFWDEDDEAYEISDFTTRSLNWHEKSKAAQYAAVLLGRTSLEGLEGMSTRHLINRTCQLVLKEVNGKNYVQSILPAKKRKGAPPPEEGEVDF